MDRKFFFAGLFFVLIPCAFANNNQINSVSLPPTVTAPGKCAGKYTLTRQGWEHGE